MRSRQHDRFVLIGLCWLYGRSELPPPPPRTLSGGLFRCALLYTGAAHQGVNVTTLTIQQDSGYWYKDILVAAGGCALIRISLMA